MKLLFGTFILWINWYSFNVGSTMAVSQGGVEAGARVAVTTTLAASAGAMTAIVLSEVTTGFIEPEPLTTGLLGALVGITAPCAVVTEAEALVIGAIGSLVAIYATRLEVWLRIDDPCSAFAIHGAAGIWGVIAVGLFAQPEPCMGMDVKGLFRGGGGELLGVQLLACFVITLWASIMCLLTLGAMPLNPTP